MHEKLLSKQYSYRAQQEEHGKHEREFHSAHWPLSLKEKLSEHNRISCRREFSPWVRATVPKASSLGLTESQARVSESP